MYIALHVSTDTGHQQVFKENLAETAVLPFCDPNIRCVVSRNESQCLAIKVITFFLIVLFLKEKIMFDKDFDRHTSKIYKQKQAR